MKTIIKNNRIRTIARSFVYFVCYFLWGKGFGKMDNDVDSYNYKLGWIYVTGQFYGDRMISTIAIRRLRDIEFKNERIGQWLYQKFAAYPLSKGWDSVGNFDVDCVQWSWSFGPISVWEDQWGNGWTIKLKIVHICWILL